MEGVFYKSENRSEYSEGLNNFSNANNLMKDLIRKLSPEGEFGKLFEDFATNRVHTFQVQSQIESMMEQIENTVKEAISLFGKGARKFIFQNLKKYYLKSKKMVFTSRCRILLQSEVAITADLLTHLFQ